MNRLGRAALAEFVGTALLLAVIVGSGIMGERLATGNQAMALLANSVATGCGLFVLILVFAPISGAHFNPLVTAIARLERQMGNRDAAALVAAQLAGALAGVAVAHGMFDLSAWEPSMKRRVGSGQWLAEGVATFGLLMTVLGARAHGIVAVAAAVGCYIAGAYWFTASTSFANPTVTLARALTPTFAGIAPENVAGFIAAQCIGAAIAYGLSGSLGLRPREPSLDQ